MKSLLVLTHDTSLSGAPKSLLLVLQQLKLKNYNITTIALKGEGALENTFKEISSEYYNLESYSNNKIYNLKNRFLRIISKRPILSDKELIVNQINKQNFDLIYINTISSLKIGLRYFYKTDTPFLLHIHELKTVIDEFFPNLNSKDELISHYIVPSHLNKQTLINKYEIKSNKISVVRETSTLPNKSKIESDTLKIIMCGGAYWRKGDDLFVQLAAKIIEKIPTVDFYWVGHISQERLRVNTADAEKLGISEKIHFIQETITPENWICNSDLFLLTSREDPFPLAAIEAAMAGLPIICFEKATGIAELIQQEMIIPYLNIEKMTEKALEILQDKHKRVSIGNDNKNTFSKLNPTNIANEIENVILQTINHP